MPIDAEIMGIVAAVLAVLGGAGVLLLSVFFRRSPPPPSPPTIDTTTVDKAVADTIDQRAREVLGANKEQAAKITAALEGDDPARDIAEILRRR